MANEKKKDDSADSEDLRVDNPEEMVAALNHLALAQLLESLPEDERKELIRKMTENRLKSLSSTR